MNSRINVIVGILYNSNKDKVLITKRTSKQYLSGYWEFPGGKTKKNEDSFSALSREFYEELGVSITKAKRLIKINHDYIEKKVLLDVWKIYEWDGDPYNRENQEIRWPTINNLSNYNIFNLWNFIIYSSFFISFFISLIIQLKNFS